MRTGQSAARLARACVGVLVACGLGVHARTTINQSQADDLRVRVTKIDGTTATFTSPTDEPWRVEVDGFSVTLDVRAVKDIVRLTDVRFRATFVNGDTVEASIAPVASKTMPPAIGGRGEWGRTRIPWAQVERVEALHAGRMAAPAEGTAVFEVRSTTGRTLDVRVGQTGDWTLKNETFQLALNRPRLRILEAGPDGTWTVAFDDGVSLVGKAIDAATLTGASSWGLVTIPFARVQRIVARVVEPAPGRQPAPAAIPHARLTLRSGATFPVEKVQRSADFQMDEAKIGVDLATVSSITASGEPDRFLVNGAMTLTAPTAPVTLTTPYGGVTVSWRDITRLEVSAAPVPRVNPPPDHFTIETNGGASLVAWDLRRESGTFTLDSPGLTLVSLTWNRVESFRRDADGLALTMASGDVFRIVKGGVLTGRTSVGQLRVDLADVRAMSAARRAAAPAAAGSASHARVTLRGGRVLRASGLALVVTGTKLPADTWEIRRDGLRFWIAQDFVKRTTFVSDGKRLSANLFGEPQEFDPAVFTFTTADGEFRAETSALEKIEPPAPSPASPPRRTTQPAMSVSVTLRSGETRTFSAEQVRFANYPRTAWSGSYQTRPVNMWPFQWQYASELLVRRIDDRAVIAVELANLVGIAVTPVATYAGRLQLRSTAGNDLLVEQVMTGLNAESKRGPSAWESADAGLVITIDSDRRVFVPFAGVTQIAFQR